MFPPEQGRQNAVQSKKNQNGGEYAEHQSINVCENEVCVGVGSSDVLSEVFMSDNWGMWGLGGIVKSPIFC